MVNKDGFKLHLFKSCINTCMIETRLGDKASSILFSCFHLYFILSFVFVYFPLLFCSLNLYLLWFCTANVPSINIQYNNTAYYIAFLRIRYCKSLKHGVNIIQRDYSIALDKRALIIAVNGNSSSKFNWQFNKDGDFIIAHTVRALLSLSYCSRYT